jgi:hypothetical protein
MYLWGTNPLPFFLASLGHSIELAQWLHRLNISFVFRQKQDTTFRQKGRSFQPLNTIPIYPGIRQFYTNIKLTQKRGFGRFNLAVYWKRKYRGKQDKEAWYLLTNLSDLESAVKIYRQRFGIEAMFKDCKTGGYNLESSQASPDRLVRLIFAHCFGYDQCLVTWSKNSVTTTTSLCLSLW